MIVVCKKCYTPFLVPDSLLKEKGKTVKCGKCGHKWVEIPKRVETPHPTVKEDSFIAPPQEIIKRAKVQVRVFKRKITEEAKEEFKLKNLLRDLKKALIISGSALLLGTIIFLSAQSLIVAQWPITQQIYIGIGWVKEERESLVLQSVKSERRYIDGAMQIIVKGRIHSVAEKTQVIPDIYINGIGPDERIIQSWRISPPKATIRPGKTIPFRSSVISPEGTVIEINLSFVEKPYEKED